MLLGGCLVLDDGRFRVPGTKYTTLKNLEPVIKGEPSQRSLNSSRHSLRSRKSNTNSKQGSRPHKPMSNQSTRRSESKPLKSPSKDPFKTTGHLPSKKPNHPHDELFEEKVVPTIPTHMMRPTHTSGGSREATTTDFRGYRLQPTGNLSASEANTRLRERQLNPVVGRVRGGQGRATTQQGGRSGSNPNKLKSSQDVRHGKPKFFG